MWSLPANLVTIHEAEETCWAEAIALIAADADLQEHIALIEGAMDALIFFAGRRSNDGEDEETMQLLGLRLFNDCAAALKLLLGGYAQASAMALRDIMETGFLVAYLARERGLISVWRKSDDRTRKTKFAPWMVREALERRDGFKDGKRAKHYAVLCKMASHPTFLGFQLLAPEGQGCQGGPFTDRRILAGLLDEMSIVVCAAMPALVAFFPPKSKLEMGAKLCAMSATARRLERFGYTPVSTAELAETTIHVARLPDDEDARRSLRHRLDMKEVFDRYPSDILQRSVCRLQEIRWVRSRPSTPPSPSVPVPLTMRRPLLLECRGYSARTLWPAGIERRPPPRLGG